MAEWNITREGLRGIARRLRGIGVYRPSVSIDGERLIVESYPLTAYVRSGFDSENGPIHHIKLNDCTLLRIGQDATVTTMTVYIGQDLIGKLADLLRDFHAPAHARSLQQDADALARHSEVPCEKSIS